MKIINYVLIIIILLLTVGCITSNRDEELRRIALLFNATEVGVPLVFESDTLVITEFKFALNKFNVISDKDVILQTGDQITALIFAYTEVARGERLILDADMGIRQVDTFVEYEMFLEPVGSRVNVFDNDFFGENQNYSVIIKGTLDGFPFVFRSSKAFEKKYSYDPVILGANRETLTILKKISMSKIFVDEDGNFLNPVFQSSEDQIIINLENNLEVEMSAASIFDTIR